MQYCMYMRTIYTKPFSIFHLKIDNLLKFVEFKFHDDFKL